MNKVTLWSVLSKDGTSKHNHIQDGWVEGDKPKQFKDEFVNQSAWKKIDWEREYAFISDDNKIIHMGI